MFNIDDHLVSGASMKMVLINADDGASVIWNSGGYASLGASDTFIGTLFAKDYVSVGAGTSVAVIGSSCCGVFSTTSYIAAGASTRIGGTGCSGIGSGFDMVGGVSVRSNNIPSIPEPASYWMMLVGLGLLDLHRAPRKTAIFS